ncbi:ATP-binding cassette domain-containing protein [Oligella urethralis]|uniref:ribosomal protection-like ABC-F family protein n=1 Tax=Oligella urethralis TaxID=90245 RepID=UPI000660F44C|nr:ATP-binding cassette domain-containing protein [Oligella urethralis]AVL71292.1 ABC transporter [Oligella urethralis]MDK6202805.1 ATP-binding cassette domain-containing protein [Oligella urethralis]
MIKAQGLTLRRGTKLLLDEAEFTINPGERVGIVGKNGAGKSTLFALIQGHIEQDAGTLTIPQGWEIAAVSQDVYGQEKIARDFVIDGDSRLRALQKARAEVSEDDGMAIAELETALSDAGHWSAESRAEQLLAGLGFAPETWDKAVSEFSGGWQVRLSIARALMKPSDLLLLDEPTNHLDLDAMLWLEQWLAAYQGTVLLISHDTEFLNNVARVILHFEQHKLQRYRGNYESFIEQQAERMAQHEQAYEKQQKEIQHMQSFIDRFKAKATKAKQAQSRVKALNRMQKLAPLQLSSGISFSLPQPEQMPDPLIIIDKIDLGYEPTQPILKNVSMMIRAGARIGMLGVNGAGKSTFIKSLVGELEPLSGTIKTAKGVNIAYFAQQQLDMLDPQATPLLHMIRIAPNEREQSLRDYLGGFGFIGEQALAKVEPFSGGEKARLALALLVWKKPNLLLLDEPSNHLDVDMREALARALTQFEGSILLVSHDRHLLRSTTDELMIVADGSISEFDGDLDDYQQWLTDKKATERQESTLAKQQDRLATTDEITPLDRRARRRQEAEERQRLGILKKPLIQELKQIESKLEKALERLEELQKAMSDENFYSDENRDNRIAQLSEHGQLEAQKNQLEERWLELTEAIEQIDKS